MSLKIDIEELINAQVISQSTADDIASYYKSKEASSSGRLLVIFAVLGAILIGSGIILILAHNWDQMPRFLKTIIAFLPLIVGQVLCGYTLSRKSDSKAWREGSSVFLILTIGACIALVSQIYNLPGDLRGFIRGWMILALPIVYIMYSRMGSVLYVMASIQFAILTFGGHDFLGDAAWYSLLIGAVIPFYYHLTKERPVSNAVNFLHWLVPISILFGVGILAHYNEGFMGVTYMSLLGLFYMIGHRDSIQNKGISSSGYLIIGALGTIGLLLVFSFDGFWEWNYSHGTNDDSKTLYAMISAIIISLLAFAGLIYHDRQGTLDNLTPVMPVFLVFIALFVLGKYQPGLSQILINFVILAIAIFTIKSGVKHDHLGILNYGLIIITALLICRFFDTDLTFVLRGVLFIVVGVAFFVVNNIILKRRRAQ